MNKKIVVYDPTVTDENSRVRGVGRYLQILKENFPQWQFLNKREILQQKNIDVLINPFFNFFQKPLFLKKVAKKQIAVIHDLIPLKYPKHFPIGLKGRLSQFFNRLFLKNYDLVITDSYASKNDIVNILKLSENKIKVIYPCLPKVFTENKLKTQNSKLKTTSKNSKLKKNYQRSDYSFDICPLSFEINSNFCLYVGDATWNKNLVNLAKAIKIINVTAVFVGKVFNDLRDQKLTHPWQKSLWEFFSLTKNDKRFIFLGYVTDDQLIQLYQRAKVNLLVSFDEGFGFSYLEAASQKCPSVISKINVLKEVSNDQGILIADPNNTNEIANQIGEIYFNNEIRNRLGNQAYQRNNFFNQKKFVGDFLNIID